MIIKDRRSATNKAEDNKLYSLTNIETPQSYTNLNPWLFDLEPPTNAYTLKISHDYPTQELELAFINGFRCEDSRNIMYWTSHNHIVFPAASLGVVFDIVKND